MLLRGVWLRAAAAALALCAGALADAQDRVFDERKLSEKALIDALSARPPVAAADAELGRTRGFKPSTPAPTPPPDAPRRASILVTFVVDSAELTPRAKVALDVVARAMQSPQLADRAFTVEGHADPRGSEAHNLALSGARAASVVAYLVSAHGVAQGRLGAVGMGSSRLMNTRDPTAAENRRVTLVAR